MPKIYYVEYYFNNHDFLPTTVFFGRKSHAESFVKKLKKQYGLNVTATIKQGKIQMIETEEE